MSNNVSFYQFAADTAAEDADGNGFVIPAGTWSVRLATAMASAGRLDCVIDLGAGGRHTMTRVALRDLGRSGKAVPVVPAGAKPVEKVTGGKKQ